MPVNPAEAYSCPICDEPLIKSDLPRHNVYWCGGCKEIIQVIDDVAHPIGLLLERNRLGDDRVRAAISKPHVSTVVSFIEVFENTTRFFSMDLANASGALRTVLAQIENRVDFAIAELTGWDLASDVATRALRALREARELVSTLPSRSRGIGDATNGKPTQS